MTRGSAEQTLVVSAAIVAGLWAYEQWEAPNGLGGADYVKFATAWGAIFLLLALLAMASPDLAAALAILIVAGDLLTNGQKLIGAVTANENAPPSTSTSGASGGAVGGGGVRLFAAAPSPSSVGAAAIPSGIVRNAAGKAINVAPGGKATTAPAQAPPGGFGVPGYHYDPSTGEMVAN